MLKEETRRGISEVLFILNNTKKSDVEKIPPRFIMYLKENASKEYKPDFKLQSDINVMELYPDTKNILGLIYREYWCDDISKERFDRILAANDKKIADGEIEKFETLFVNKTLEKKKFSKENIENINEQELSLKKESFFSSFFKTLKEKTIKIFKH